MPAVCASALPHLALTFEASSISTVAPTASDASWPSRARESAHVKVAVIGAGPAGLYSALLLKKANPAHEITVLERNRAHDTFGWGVVFSDQTLENFRAADEPT